MDKKARIMHYFIVLVMVMIMALLFTAVIQGLT